jgi:hypothetical protein
MDSAKRSDSTRVPVDRRSASVKKQYSVPELTEFGLVGQLSLAGSKATKEAKGTLTVLTLHS